MKYKDFFDYWEKERPFVKYNTTKQIALDAWDACVNSFPVEIYQKQGGEGQVNVQVMPIFEINKSWHPDYNVNPANWEKMTLKEIMDEFQIGIDEINKLMENNAIRLISV